MMNNGPKPVKIGGRERIAQLILDRISIPQLIVPDDLDKAKEGKKTFGGTSEQKVTVFRVNSKQSLFIPNKRNRRMLDRFISTPMIGPLN